MQLHSARCWWPKTSFWKVAQVTPVVTSLYHLRVSPRNIHKIPSRSGIQTGEYRKRDKIMITTCTCGEQNDSSQIKGAPIEWRTRRPQSKTCKRTSRESRARTGASNVIKSHVNQSQLIRLCEPYFAWSQTHSNWNTSIFRCLPGQLPSSKLIKMSKRWVCARVLV